MMMRRWNHRLLVLALACAGPVFVALFHGNMVAVFGHIIRGHAEGRPLPTATALIYDHTWIVVLPLLLLAAMNALLLFRAWRRGQDELQTARWETRACLIAGLVTYVWMFGMVCVTLLPYLGTKALKPEAPAQSAAAHAGSHSPAT